MDFAIPEDLQKLRESTRRFVDEHLMPLETRYAEEPDLPDDVRHALQAKAKELGFWIFDLPEEYGGGGIGALGRCLVFEELARCNVPAFRAPSVFTPYLGPVLFKCDSAQREKYLEPVLRGSKRTCFALTEPNGGSDPSDMRTVARRDGDGYRVTGTKIFITGADKADFIQLFARSDEGISCFLVDRDTPGVTLGQSFELMTPDRPWELVFDDAWIPATQRIGEAGKGWHLAREFLDEGRLAHGPKALGRAQRALELAVDHANQRKTFGEPLAKRQAIQWMIADSAVELHSARLMTYHAAWLAEQGRDYHFEASAVKLHADEVLMRIVDRAIQIHGGIGLSREMPLELMFRDARSRLITEGSSEMQRIIIASHVLSRRGPIDRVAR